MKCSLCYLYVAGYPHAQWVHYGRQAIQHVSAVKPVFLPPQKLPKSGGKIVLTAVSGQEGGEVLPLLDGFYSMSHQHCTCIGMYEHLSRRKVKNCEIEKKCGTVAMVKTTMRR